MDAAGPITEGYAQAGQYKTQAALSAQQAKDVALQSIQSSEQRREQLNSALSTIAANRAGAGLSNDSPTAMAIQKAVARKGNRDEQITRLGYLNQGQSLRWQSAAQKKAARSAVTGGYIKGFVAVGKTAAAAMGA